MCAAKDPDEWEGALGETIGFKCNVWHRPLPPATGDTAGDGDGDPFNSGSGVNLGKSPTRFACRATCTIDWRQSTGTNPDCTRTSSRPRAIFSAFLD